MGVGIARIPVVAALSVGDGAAQADGTSLCAVSISGSAASRVPTVATDNDQPCRCGAELHNKNAKWTAERVERSVVNRVWLARSWHWGSRGDGSELLFGDVAVEGSLDGGPGVSDGCWWVVPVAV